MAAQPERYLVIPNTVPAQNLLEDLRYREVLIDLRARDALEPSEMRLQDNFVLREVLRGLHGREALDATRQLLHSAIVGHHRKAGVDVQVVLTRKLLRVGQLDAYFGRCAHLFSCLE